MERSSNHPYNCLNPDSYPTNQSHHHIYSSGSSVVYKTHAARIISKCTDQENTLKLEPGYISVSPDTPEFITVTLSDSGLSYAIPQKEATLYGGISALSYLMEYVKIQQIFHSQCILIVTENIEICLILDEKINKVWLPEMARSISLSKGTPLRRGSVENYLLKGKKGNKTEYLGNIFDIFELPSNNKGWAEVKVTFLNELGSQIEYFLLDLSQKHIYSCISDILMSLYGRINRLNHQILCEYLIDISRMHSLNSHIVSPYRPILLYPPGYFTIQSHNYTTELLDIDPEALEVSIKGLICTYENTDLGDSIGDAINLLYIQKLSIIQRATVQTKKNLVYSGKYQRSNLSNISESESHDSNNLLELLREKAPKPARHSIPHQCLRSPVSDLSKTSELNLQLDSLSRYSIEDTKYEIVKSPNQIILNAVTPMESSTNRRRRCMTERSDHRRTQPTRNKQPKLVRARSPSKS